jgi:NAD(P)-dependent dehydrogenase (short-subunit alcohol dehydrogenase family)
MGKAFQRRIVVVAGASTPIGRAIVHAFAARGAHVGLIVRGAEGLDVGKQDVEEMGGRALVLPLEISDPAAVEAAAETVERELGPIDVWVNDGTVSFLAPVVETTPGEFKHVMEVTYLGYVYGTLAALKRMRARDRGKIIQIGSALAYRPMPLQSAHCAAQHAVRGFTDSLRMELRHDRSNVRVTEVQIPVVDLPRFSSSAKPVRQRVLKPEAVADAVVFASEHDRREVSVGWPRVETIVSVPRTAKPVVLRAPESRPIARPLVKPRHLVFGLALATIALAVTFRRRPH